MVKKPTIKQLNAFYWTVKLGSQTAAAEYLFVTPPAVGTLVHAIEERCGIKLFPPNSAKPNEHGRVLFRMLETHAAFVKSLENSMRTEAYNYFMAAKKNKP